MRVLQLGPFPPPHGGVASNLVAIHRELLERGIEARVMNITGTRRPSTDRVEYPSSALKLLRLLIRSRADIVHLHVGGRLTTRLLALCWVCTALPGVRSVLTFHSGGYAQSASKGTARRFSLPGLVFRRFDCVIVVNEQMRQLFEQLGVSRRKLRLIPPYSTSPRFAENAGLRTDLPEAMEDFFSSHSPVLVTVGALEPEYDLDFQIQLLPQVAQRLPEVGLMVIGGGSGHHATLETISRAGLGDRVMLCGDVPHEITLRAIHRAAAVLRTTKYDGDSIAVREALASGRSVIASDNGMRPPGTELFPVGDREAFMAALTRALAGVRSAAPPDSAPAGAEAVLELYRELLPQNTGP